MNPRWTLDDPKMNPNWAPNGPRMMSCSSYHNDDIMMIWSSWSHHDDITMVISSWWYHHDDIMMIISSWSYDHHDIIMMIRRTWHHPRSVRGPFWVHFRVIQQSSRVDLGFILGLFKGFPEHFEASSVGLSMILAQNNFFSSKKQFFPDVLQLHGGVLGVADHVFNGLET